MTGVSGTSAAAAVASGAAALMIERLPTIDPASLKQLLIQSADNSRNTAFPGAPGKWDATLGWGLLNVGAAIELAKTRTANARFPNCETPSRSGTGQPCSLRSGGPIWLNTQDITTATPPRAGVANTIQVQVVNDGPNDATVDVNFGVYVFGVGGNQFHHVGTKQVTIPANQAPVTVTMPWTPGAPDHQCVQVSIAFAADSDYSDNVTQRNLEIAPSVYTMRVENPFMVPARFELSAVSDRAGWQCSIDQTTFDLDPFKDCARDVTIEFHAPPGTPVGAQGNCNVAVRGTPQGEREGRLVGGVTVQTFVPRPCKVVGEIVDARGRPIAGARVVVTRAYPKTALRAPRPSAREDVTSADGIFAVEIAGRGALSRRGGQARRRRGRANPGSRVRGRRAATDASGDGAYRRRTTNRRTNSCHACGRSPLITFGVRRRSSRWRASRSRRSPAFRRARRGRCQAATSRAAQRGQRVAKRLAPLAKAAVTTRANRAGSSMPARVAKRREPGYRGLDLRHRPECAGGTTNRRSMRKLACSITVSRP